MDTTAPLSSESRLSGRASALASNSDSQNSPGAPVLTRPRTDKHIWGIYIALVVISLIELYSASSREVTAGNIMTPLIRHAILLGAGFVIMLGLQRVHYKVFYNWTWIIVLLSLGIAIATMFFGQIINGARRSLSFGLFSLQSSEVLKFAAALLVARVVGDGQIKTNGEPDVSTRAVTVVATVILIFCGLLVNQGLTNTLLLMSISLSLLFIGGVKLKKFGVVLAIYLSLGAGYMTYSTFKAQSGADGGIELSQGKEKDRSTTRVNRFIEHFKQNKYEQEITSDNQQAQYSFIAQANGGLFGVGPGNSRETARLPLAFSDYIYAIIIEDGGFIAGFIVIALYLMLLARAGRVGTRCRKAFPTLLIIGMAIFIVYQALFHMAIVTGVFPVSGQPLPFISKGGSSVIISSIALGIMLSVSRYASRRDETTASSEKQLSDNPILKS